MPTQTSEGILQEAVDRAMQASPRDTITTGLISKNTWDKGKVRFAADIEFVRFHELPGQEKSSTGSPNNSRLGWGEIKKRITFSAED